MTHAEPGARLVAVDVEEVRWKATLAALRQEFHGLVRRHAEISRRLAELDDGPICAVRELNGALERLARRWFPPDVSREIDDKLQRLSAPLVQEAEPLTVNPPPDH